MKKKNEFLTMLQNCFSLVLKNVNADLVITFICGFLVNLLAFGVITLVVYTPVHVETKFDSTWEILFTDPRSVHASSLSVFRTNTRFSLEKEGPEDCLKDPNNFSFIRIIKQCSLSKTSSCFARVYVIPNEAVVKRCSMEKDLLFNFDVESIESEVSGNVLRFLSYRPTEIDLTDLMGYSASYEVDPLGSAFLYVFGSVVLSLVEILLLFIILGVSLEILDVLIK